MKRHSKEQMTARFWVWHDGGLVKLSIRPGECIQVGGGGPCDEGCHYWNKAWELEDGVLEERNYSYSRDCDGPLERHSEREADVHELVGTLAYYRNGWSENTGPVETMATHNGRMIYTPNWRKVSSGQRDHYAEAMGY